MKRSLYIALVGYFLLWTSSACATSLMKRIEVTHDVVQPGHSITQVVSINEMEIPLITVIDHARATTVLYSIEFVNKDVVWLRCYNYGWYPQGGDVTLGVWR